MQREPLERPVNGLFRVAAAATGRGELSGLAGLAAAHAAPLAADRTERRHHVGCGRRLGAKVGELHGQRRRIDIGGVCHDFDRRDCDLGRHRDVSRDIGCLDLLLFGQFLLELVELVLNLGCVRCDDPWRLFLRGLVDDQRHGEQRDDVDEHADGPRRRLPEGLAARRIRAALRIGRSGLVSRPSLLGL